MAFEMRPQRGRVAARIEAFQSLDESIDHNLHPSGFHHYITHDHKAAASRTAKTCDRDSTARTVSGGRKVGGQETSYSHIPPVESLRHESMTVVGTDSMMQPKYTHSQRSTRTASPVKTDNYNSPHQSRTGSLQAEFQSSKPNQADSELFMARSRLRPLQPERRIDDELTRHRASTLAELEMLLDSAIEGHDNVSTIGSQPYSYQDNQETVDVGHVHHHLPADNMVQTTGHAQHLISDNRAIVEDDAQIAKAITLSRVHKSLHEESMHYTSPRNQPDESLSMKKIPTENQSDTHQSPQHLIDRQADNSHGRSGARNATFRHGYVAATPHSPFRRWNSKAGHKTSASKKLVGITSNGSPLQQPAGTHQHHRRTSLTSSPDTQDSYMTAGQSATVGDSNLDNFLRSHDNNHHTHQVSGDLSLGEEQLRREQPSENEKTRTLPHRSPHSIRAPKQPAEFVPKINTVKNRIQEFMRATEKNTEHKEWIKGQQTQYVGRQHGKSFGGTSIRSLDQGVADHGIKPETLPHLQMVPSEQLAYLDEKPGSMPRPVQSRSPERRLSRLGSFHTVPHTPEKEVVQLDIKRNPSTRRNKLIVTPPRGRSRVPRDTPSKSSPFAAQHQFSFRTSPERRGPGRSPQRVQVEVEVRGSPERDPGIQSDSLLIIRANIEGMELAD